MENHEEPFEIYSEEEMEVIESHIEEHFGPFANVLHEIASTDIHVDICVIAPTAGNPFYTLVTMGMGAHKMNVPPELLERKIDRGEILVKLPPDWDIKSPDEEWYWPLRWLKILARLPGNHDSWIGRGHSVPNGEPFAGNTRLSGVLLELPYTFGRESEVCKLPNGDEVNFYQMLPLYEEEMQFKIEHGTDKLTELFDDSFSDVVDIARTNYCKETDASSRSE